MSKTMLIPIELILVDNDRQEGGMGDLDGLARSINQPGVGLIHAISVRKLTDGYELCAGRRRLAAAARNGWKEIRAEVYDTDEPFDPVAVQLAENVNRLDMHPLDEAVLFNQCIKDGDRIEDLAALYMRSVSGIYQRLQLLKLIDAARDLFRKGRLSITQASMVATLDEETQGKVIKHIARCPGLEIPKWILEEAVHKNVPCIIGEFFQSEKCASCQTRTRFSDCSLYPEMQLGTDYCCDEKCYRESYVEFVRKTVHDMYEDEGVDFKTVKTTPYLIEFGNPPFPLAGMKMDIGGKLFSVIAASEITAVDETFTESIRHTGIVVAGNKVGEVVLFAFDKDLRETEDEGKKSKEEESVVEITSSDEQKAYNDVIKKGWDINNLVRNKVMSRYAMMVFGQIPSSDSLKELIEHFFDIETIRFVFKYYDDELDDDIIENGSKWLDKYSPDEIKSRVFDLLLHERLTGMYVNILHPDLESDNIVIMNGMGINTNILLGDLKNEYAEEVRRRMNQYLDGKSESTEEKNPVDDDREAESDDECSDTSDEITDNSQAEENPEETKGGAVSAEPFPVCEESEDVG